MRKLFIITLILILGCITLAGCKNFGPYQVDVQQGNVLEQSSLKKLHLGMTKDEVRATFGAPVLSDTFDDNYWTYVYTNQINGGKVEMKKLNLTFKNNELQKISP